MNHTETSDSFLSAEGQRPSIEKWGENLVLTPTGESITILPHFHRFVKHLFIQAQRESAPTLQVVALSSCWPSIQGWLPNSPKPTIPTHSRPHSIDLHLKKRHALAGGLETENPSEAVLDAAWPPLLFDALYA